MKTLAAVTADEFLKIAHVLGPCELERGEIIRMSPGGGAHSSASANVAFVLSRYAKSSKRGRVLSNEAGLVVEQDPDTVRGADALFLSYKRLPKGAVWSGFVRHAPELVVEVKGDDDSWTVMEKKVGEYHAFGVDMVWVVDPKTLSVRTYPNKGAEAVLHSDDTLWGGKLMPGFKCKVAEFFED